jgi:hypothetical protein
MRSTSRQTMSPFSHTPSARVMWSGPREWGGSQDRVCDPGLEPLAEELARVAALLANARIDQPPTAPHLARGDRRVREALVGLQRVERLVRELTTDAASADDRPPEDRLSDPDGRGEWVAAGLCH